MNEREFNSLPLEQRKAAQQRLIDAGLYNGSADGKWGAGTKTAFEAEDRQRSQREASDREAQAQARKDQLEAERIANERAKIEQTGSKEEAERAAKAAREAEANSPGAIARNVASFTAAPIIGYGAGQLMGGLADARADKAQAAKNASLAAGAESRLQGLTTREGARLGAERSGAMPSSNPLLRTSSRMLPHTIGGLGMLAKGGAVFAMDDPENSPLIRDINHGVGMGFLGSGVGLLERGAGYATSPGVSPNARDISIIESNQLRRNPLMAQSAPPIDVEATPVRGPQKALPAPQSAPDEVLRHSVRLSNAASAAGVKPGRSKSATYTALVKGVTDENVAAVAKALDLPETVGKAGVLQRARELVRTGGKSAVFLPLAAAGAAYEMSRPAEASDGSSSGGSPALAAGVAGGTAYGASKALQAIPPMVGTALGMAGEAMAPSFIDTATDYSPDELAQGRNFLARHLPAPLRAGGVESAYQMAQVPERNPLLAAPAAPDPFDEALGRFETFMSNR